MADEADYVVVGGGSAGAAVVQRLAEAGHSVLLLEAGPPDRNPWIHVPMGFAKTFLDPRVNWKYVSDPEPNVGGRKIYWPRGKVLGGSSAINGMVYIRGVPSDYDRWRQMGNEGWSFADCLPHFRRLEAHPLGDTELHGADGPVGVSATSYRTELSEAFIAAAVEAGLPRNDDFNGARQEGVGYYHLTVRRGARASTARAYLAPARRQAGCRIVTDALVERVEFEGARAVAVRYRRGGQGGLARARREIVLCAGAIGSPQILQLSGVGPGSLLRGHGIEVVRDLPGVGENLIDHWGVRAVFRCTKPVTLNDRLGTPLGRVRAALEWAIARRGPLTISPGHVGVFARTQPESEDPDVQIHCYPFSTDRIDRGPDPFPGFTVLMNQSRPESRGRLAIKSADPAVAPSMFANYLASERDRRTAVAGLRLIRRIVRGAPMRPWVAEERIPRPALESDEELLAYAREIGQSAYHPVGTCRMGRDANAVVDPRLRVHGVDGLRVADAAIMPELVSGNTNAACMMIGEKAADMILADARR